VRLLDSLGREVESVTSGDPVRLEVTVSVAKDTDDPSFGFLIRDRLGNDIFGTNSFLMHQKIGRLKAGTRHKVTYDLAMDLGASIYTIALAAHAADTHIADNYDWINDALAFRVMHSQNERFSGYARLKPAFSIASIEGI
jgi:lipopolysaccharide transport system ATP-binding protein